MDITPPPNEHKPRSELLAKEDANAPHPPKPTPEPAKPRHSRPFGPIISTVTLLVVAIGLAFCISAFVLQSYQVDGHSMETTLQDNDRLIVNKIPRTWARLTGHPYIPKRGDIIIFNQSGLFDSSGQAEKQLVKRVIGLPGDHVVVKDGKITVYNSQYPNGFNPDKTVGYHITAPITPSGTYSDVTLGPGQLFVCGDNRTNSEDSRYFGPINANQVVGQLMLRIVPLSKAEKF